MPTIPATSSDNALPHAPDYEKLGQTYGSDLVRFLNSTCGSQAIEFFSAWRAIEESVFVSRLEFLHAAGASVEQLTDFTLAAKAAWEAGLASDPLLHKLVRPSLQPTFH